MNLRPFDLNLRHLRALSAAVEQGTLSAAAARVGLSQPALTQGLSKLEAQLGTRLFERHPGGLTPTSAGAEMAARAATAFRLLAEASRATMNGGRGFSRPEQLMTATQLDAFLRVADAGSFVGGARASGLSQPALHRAARELEQVIGLPLIERRGRGVALTAHGRRFARGIRLAEREIAAGIAELSADPAGTGRITIGAMPLSRALVLPRALSRFTRQAPGVTVEVVEGSWRELVDPLSDGVIDLMIGALRDPPPPGLTQRALFDDRLAVIARAGHPLAGIAAPDRAALAAYPWVVGSPQTPLHAHWRRLFDDHPLPPAPIACGSVMVIRGLLGESDLLTLLSPDQVALEIAAGVLTTIGPPLAGSIRHIGLTTRTDWRPTAMQRRLIALIEEASASL
ncbi:LysR family transcriptional regulator [Sphingomonas sp. MMSM20]|uniref:LysR family transcriptional regulator n=1 Tax=Sphingomonas lycopersici TaxID=2951807 RepID=UPI00223804C9|nr:LysR family transcriptional regulator [Sphingomonas lycopersici]MCW6530558.1 LysR family transcriptional regulator [Sphingomonas lycopersici]